MICPFCSPQVAQSGSRSAKMQDKEIAPNEFLELVVIATMFKTNGTTLASSLAKLA